MESKANSLRTDTEENKGAGGWFGYWSSLPLYVRIVVGMGVGFFWVGF